MSRALIVALDGPAGAGKSTVAKMVAEKAGLALVDTGAIYRTVALLALQQGLSVDDGDALGRIAQTLPARLRFVVEGGNNRVFLDPATSGETVQELTASIRSHEVSAAASSVARHPSVRSALLDLQRALGRRGKGSVLEGRDIGTVVFPDADVKAFVTASPQERARRRLNELEEKGTAGGETHESVLRDIIARDKQDAERPVAPLKAADDAVIVDTTGKTLAQVTDEILALVNVARSRSE
ncbi:MAG: (d)CMP kinase [Deltaproteobacteria bacterium]|nr:(d)CMP kinase [Deltaproteobacteria bacterium]